MEKKRMHFNKSGEAFPLPPGLYDKKLLQVVHRSLIG